MFELADPLDRVGTWSLVKFWIGPMSLDPRHMHLKSYRTDAARGHLERQLASRGRDGDAGADRGMPAASWSSQRCWDEDERTWWAGGRPRAVPGYNKAMPSFGPWMTSWKLTVARIQ